MTRCAFMIFAALGVSLAAPALAQQTGSTMTVERGGTAKGCVEWSHQTLARPSTSNPERQLVYFRLVNKCGREVSVLIASQTADYAQRVGDNGGIVLDPRRQENSCRPAFRGHQGKEMLGYKCRTDSVDREYVGHRCGIELAKTLLGFNAVRTVQQPGRHDQQIKLSIQPNGKSGRGEGIFVEDVYSERHHDVLACKKTVPTSSVDAREPARTGKQIDKSSAYPAVATDYKRALALQTTLRRRQ